METKNNERKEAEALMNRLKAQFGDVDLDMELLGLGEDEDKQAVAAFQSEDAEQQSSLSSLAVTNAVSQTQSTVDDAIADAEAAALMARLGSQFGDLDMSQLGLGGCEGRKGGDNSNRNSNSNGDYDCGRDSDEESSLEDPTPEELEAWQASQFSRGQTTTRTQSHAFGGGGALESIQQRRKQLRESRSRQLVPEQARIRLQNHLPGASGALEQPSETAASDILPTTTTAASVLDILGGDTSSFFGPSNTSILEELVSEEADGDSEILQTSWKRLYASYEQGLGFWNLWKAFKGYDGPTLLVLRCLPSASKTLGAGAAETQTATACLGFYTTTPWKGSQGGMFGGDIECEDGDKAFLFSIDEKDHKPQHNNNKNNSNKSNESQQQNNHRVRFFPVERKTRARAAARANNGGGKYMYCQPSSKTSNGTVISKAVAVTGLGVGGRPTQPRFHLTENFEDCSCLTYDSGRATRDGDLFAGSDDETTTNDINCKISKQPQNHGSSSSSNSSCDDEGHAFAKALYSFDVIELEAWGVGGENWINHALREREQAREQHILRFQKVDKQMMWKQGAFGSNSNRSSSRTQSGRET